MGTAVGSSMKIDAEYHTRSDGTDDLSEVKDENRRDGHWLDLDRGTCKDAIGRREFGLQHLVTNHPLLSLDAIARLADSLPPRAVERHLAKQPLLVPGGAEDLDGPPSETVLNIETSGRWMVLWNIEQISSYRRLLDEILDEAMACLPRSEGPMGRREAFLFLSAPNAITPVHFDPEHNFLLQIRGTKEINIGRFQDREAELRELDRYHAGGHRNLVEIPPLSRTFCMMPGEGVYIYPWAPHWVYNGSSVSISLSITFRTRRSQREELVHIFNAKLRRRGLSPMPPGLSLTADSAKAGSVNFLAWLRRGCRRQRGARDYS
ncbi:MAG: JmjC domain-containing protein [Gammaproteobacteria bacterium]